MILIGLKGMLLYLQYVWGQQHNLLHTQPVYTRLAFQLDSLVSNVLFLHIRTVLVLSQYFCSVLAIYNMVGTIFLAVSHPLLCNH